MKLDFDPQAREEIRKFEKEHQKYITSKLRELKDKPTDHKDCGIIRIKGRQVFKFVMKQGSKGGKDYRAIYDIKDGKVKILAVFHRDKGYNKEELSERI